ncbi:MAG: NACHT domain-containing protein [Chlamydiales bacterium]
MANPSGSTSSSIPSTSAYNATQPDFKNFERVKNAVVIQDILGLFKRVTNGGSLHQLLSQENLKGKMLKQKIEKKSRTLPQGTSLLACMHCLISYYPPAQSTPMSSSSQRLQHSSTLSHEPCLDSTSYTNQPKCNLINWVKDPNRPDLKYDNPNGWIRPLYRPSRNGTLVPPPGVEDEELLEELDKLSKRFETFEPFVYTNVPPPQIIDTRELFLKILLQHAITTHKPNWVKYLTHIGADINAVITRDFDSATIFALKRIINASESQEILRDFSVFSTLLEARKPVDRITLFNALHFCIQNYYKNPCTDSDLIHNYRIVDETVSRLLGVKISTALLFENERKLFAQYTTSIYELGGKFEDIRSRLTGLPNTSTSQNREVELAALHRHHYINLRLRLLLQIIVENIVKSDKNDERIYDEFLSELETAWITQLITTWAHSALSSSQTNTQVFCHLLSKYIFKQIKSLQDGKEYNLHVGWPGHSICVVFSRIGSHLIVRVDNLGEGVQYHSQGTCLPGCSPQSAQSRVLFNLDFQNLPNTLETYLATLLDNLANSKWEKNYREKQGKDRTVNKPLIQRVYEPDQKMGLPLERRFPLNPQDYPLHPTQISRNCTFASFSVGVQKRLGDAFRTILGREVDLLNEIHTIWRADESQFNRLISQPLSLRSNNRASFSSSLISQLRGHYQSILSKSRERCCYIMQPCIDNYETKVGALVITEPDCNLPLFSSLVDAIKLSRGPNLIRIEGPAGVGKTIFSQWLSHEFQSNQRLFDYVFHISLRNLSKQKEYPPKLEGYSLIDIIEKEIIIPALGRPFRDFERQLLEEELKTKKVLWILDGLDELHHELPSFQKAILTLNTNHRVIITSRPPVKHPYIRTADKIFKIVEYSKKEIDKFIDEFFNDPSDHNALDFKARLNSALQTNLELKKLCQIPIILSRACQSVKEGDDQVLTKKNLAELFKHFIYSGCRTAFERRFKGILREGVEGEIDNVSRQQIIHHNRKAIRFTQFLAYTNFRGQRDVTPTKNQLEESFARFDIREADREKFLCELHDIGIFIPDENGGEFTHALFQEFFTALYLIKSLSKISTSSQAQAFIRTHKSDLNYQNVFLFVVHQLTHRLQQTGRVEKKEALLIQLEQFLMNFIPFDLPYPDNEETIQQVIPLINAYGQNVMGSTFKYEHFQKISLTFSQEIFAYMIRETLASHPDDLLEKTNLDDDDKIVEESPKPFLKAFLTEFLIENPELREGIKFNTKLLESMKLSLIQPSTSTASMSDQTWNVISNSIYFMEQAQSLNRSTIEDLMQIAQTIANERDLVSEMTILLLNYTRRLLSSTRSDGYEDLPIIVNSLKSLFKILTHDLPAPVTPKRQQRPEEAAQPPNHTQVAIELAAILNLTPNQEIPPDAIEEVRKLCRAGLINLTKHMLDNPSNWIDYWNIISSIPPSNFSWQTILTDRQIARLKDYIFDLYDSAYTQKNHKTYYYDLRKILKKTLNLIDLFDLNFGDMLLKKLYIISISGVTDRGSGKGYKKTDKELAEYTLSCYRPDLCASTDINLEKIRAQLRRIQMIDSKVRLKHKTQILNDLEILKERIACEPQSSDGPDQQILKQLDTVISRWSSPSQIYVLPMDNTTPAGRIENRYSPSSSLPNSNSSSSSSGPPPKRRR